MQHETLTNRDRQSPFSLNNLALHAEVKERLEKIQKVSPAVDNDNYYQADIDEYHRFCRKYYYEVYGFYDYLWHTHDGCV